jgi:hypothetical protein
VNDIDNFKQVKSPNKNIDYFEHDPPVNTDSYAAFIIFINKNQNVILKTTIPGL